MKNAFLSFLLLLVFVACSRRPSDVVRVDSAAPVFPDYAGVTIPADIAPLNLDPATPGADIDVTVRGSKGGELHANGTTADWDVDDWHALTTANRGGTLTFTVCLRQDGQWRQYRDFRVFVSRYDLGDWGLTYRRIAPGYEVYGRMGIYERCLSNFDEKAIIENTAVPGACVNCHTANRTNPDQFTFHVRGDHGATMVRDGGRTEWLKAKNDSIKGSMVYPYWHPQGRFCAYSTNNTRQGFHETAKERIEVFDLSSDILIYEPCTHRIILNGAVMTKDHFETYPAFSPDGRTLYFCSADSVPIPQRYRDVRYSLCRVAFNPATGRTVGRVDTLISAGVLHRSVTFPRPSYDGRYVLVTLSAYGCFPIWHQEADLALYDVRSHRLVPCKAWNSRDTESFHNWSANSHWVVFSSRRGDGLHTRLYLASVDSRGRLTNPFLLPQRYPHRAEMADDSYNVPDFTLRPVRLDMRRAARAIVSDKRVETVVSQAPSRAHGVH